MAVTILLLLTFHLLTSLLLSSGCVMFASDYYTCSYEMNKTEYFLKFLLCWSYDIIGDFVILASHMFTQTYTYTCLKAGSVTDENGVTE